MNGNVKDWFWCFQDVYCFKNNTFLERDTVDQEINVLALVKGTERFVFLFDDESRSETLTMLARYASNPDLSFTWYDAAVLSQKIRQEPASMEVAARANADAKR